MSRVVRAVQHVAERVLDQRVHLRVQEVVVRELEHHVHQHARGACNRRRYYSFRSTPMSLTSISQKQKNKLCCLRTELEFYKTVALSRVEAFCSNFVNIS